MSRTWFSYSVVFVSVVILFFFLVWPVSLIVKKSFISESGWTLEYFRLLFASEVHMGALYNSLLIAFATWLGVSFLSLPLAWLNSSYKFRGKGFWSAMLLVPMIMPPFVGAIGVQRFFSNYGAINLFLLERQWISEPIDWLGGENMFFVVVLLEVLHLYPVMYLNLLTSLENLDPSLEEMGRTLGGGRFALAKDVVWPLIRPGFFSGSIIVFIWALTDLGTPLLVGMHETLPVKIFNMVTDMNENPVGFAMVLVMVVLTVGTYLLSKSLFTGKNYQMLGRGHVSSRQRPASFLQTVGIVLVMGLTVLLALFPHGSVLLTSVSDSWFMTSWPEAFTLQHYNMAFAQELPLLGIKNSLLMSFMATVFDLGLGLLLAYVIARKLVPGVAFLDSLVMIPLALPGIILAFGYVYAYTGTFLDPLFNPVPLLVIAYAVRRLPYMVRLANAGLQQISSSLEEASILFGASRMFTIRKIVMPLLMANVIAGSLLCFAYAMLDVSDSLILAMKDRFYPLTKVIYSLYLEQGSGDLVASALGMVAMALITVCLLGASLVLGKKTGELFKGA